MATYMCPFPYIDAEQVESLLSYDVLTAAVEQALADVSIGETSGVIQPLRSVISLKKGVLLTMPGFSKSEDSLVCKVVTVFPGNVNTPISTIQGNIILLSSEDGSTRAIVNGESVTAMRTAAASAVSTKYLAPENSKILAILGSGVQAKSHLDALKNIIPFTEIRVWNRTHARAQDFAKKYGCTVCETVMEAVKDADVIASVTGTSTPILQSEWVKDGAHVISIGAHSPSQQELDPVLVRRAIVYADSKESALNESGDIIHSKADIFGEIGEVVLGKIKARRNETTIFKSLGLAVEDAVAAKLVYSSFQKKTMQQKL